jgi:hypothetical protein
MAPDLAQSNDAPSGLTGRAVLAFLQIVAATAVLMAVYYEGMTWLHAHHAPPWTPIAATAAYAVAILALVGLWTRGKAVKACMTTTPAARTYRRRMFISTCCYVAALMVAIFVNGSHPAPGPLAYAIAILPGLAVSGMFASMGLYLREETDEFQRQVQIESSLWASGAVLMLCAIWGFLEMFQLAPHVDAWVIVPIWSAILGVANVFTRRRYG